MSDISDLSKDDQVRKNIIDQLNSEGIELLIPIIFDSSDESAEEIVVPKEQKIDTEDERREKYANALNAMKNVTIHLHSERNLYKETEWFDWLRTNPCNSSSSKIDHIDIATFPKEDFIKEYVINGGKPCIITGAMEEKNWRAKERWISGESFKEYYGHVPIKVTEIKAFHGMGRPNEIRLPVSLYMEDVKNNTADDPFYGFEHDMGGMPHQTGTYHQFNERSAFQEDYKTPSLFEDDFYNLNPETREFYPNYRHLIVGGCRTGTNLHVDPKATSAWNTLGCGLKKWALFPPGFDADYLEQLKIQAYSKKPPSYWWQDIAKTLPADIGMIECIQKPGETIFVPAGWWHCALNLDFSVAITHNLLILPSLPFQWKSFTAEYPCFTNYLRDVASDIIEDVAQKSNTFEKQYMVDTKFAY